MKTLRKAKLAFLIVILYSTLGPFSSLIFLKFFSVNQPQNFPHSHVFGTPNQVFLLSIFFALYIVAADVFYRNSNSYLVTDEISTLETADMSTIPFLEGYANLISTEVFSLHDQDDERVNENTVSYAEDGSIPPMGYLEFKNAMCDYEGYDHEDEICHRDLSVVEYNGAADYHLINDCLSYDNQCGYEGDNEDSGDCEDDDFNMKIEEFIAAMKKKWREEMIKEKLLYLEAAKG